MLLSGRERINLQYSGYTQKACSYRLPDKKLCSSADGVRSNELAFWQTPGWHVWYICHQGTMFNKKKGQWMKQTHHNAISSMRVNSRGGVLSVLVSLGLHSPSRSTGQGIVKSHSAGARYLSPCVYRDMRSLGVFPLSPLQDRLRLDRLRQDIYYTEGLFIVCVGFLLKRRLCGFLIKKKTLPPCFVATS
jgi:hypothetical protein